MAQAPSKEKSFRRPPFHGIGDSRKIFFAYYVLTFDFATKKGLTVEVL